MVKVGRTESSDLRLGGLTTSLLMKDPFGLTRSKIELSNVRATAVVDGGTRSGLPRTSQGREYTDDGIFRVESLKNVIGIEGHYGKRSC